jgi:hypothetical protein
METRRCIQALLYSANRPKTRTSWHNLYLASPPQIIQGQLADVTLPLTFLGCHYLATMVRHLPPREGATAQCPIPDVHNSGSGQGTVAV